MVSLSAALAPNLNGVLLPDALRLGTRSFTDDQVLDPTELATISQRISAFNKVILKVAGEAGIPVVDTAGLLANAKRNGYKIGGTTLTTSFTGGIFSYDGIHPTMTGQAVIAQAFLDTINKAIAGQGSFGTLQTPIPNLDLPAVLKLDPQKPGG